MIKISPNVDCDDKCPNCQRTVKLNKTLIWQGVHVCASKTCTTCSETFLFNLPIGQAKLRPLVLKQSDGNLLTKCAPDWFSSPLKKVLCSPRADEVKMKVEQLEPHDNKVIILNTLNNCYGHSLLHFLNLQRIIAKKNGFGIIVIVQPCLKWLLPKEGINEVWTVELSFSQLKEYYSDLTTKINNQLERFDEVYLSGIQLCPKNVRIEKFSKIDPYHFGGSSVPTQDNSKPRITFVWREDSNRFWVKSYWIYGVLRKLGMATILRPLHYCRVLLFLYLLKWRLKESSYQITLAGLGKFGMFPSFVDDLRVDLFNEEAEITTCKIYSESEFVVGIHGSSMILPSAHAGMTLSIMPLKRWGNYLEDILYSESESDLRLAAFHKRIIPMNTTILETVDICLNMLLNRDYFVRKFMYEAEVV